ncbi:hypothetical protein DMUE_5119 [Dictyocoela muelleri]|nr:hypothetical protein DMUE_5119 [Dictyocoela muelleri]
MLFSFLLKIIFLFTIFGNSTKINEIEYFTGREIYITFSAYTNTIIAAKTDDKSDNPFIGVNKELDPDTFNYNDTSILRKDGDKFAITIGDYNLCRNNDALKKCNKDEEVVKWKINKNPFGYSISINDLCITKEEDVKLKLKKCTETDDQLFVFKNHVVLCDSNKAIVGNVKQDILVDNNLAPLKSLSNDVALQPPVIYYLPGDDTDDDLDMNYKKRYYQKDWLKRQKYSKRGNKKYKKKDKKSDNKKKNKKKNNKKKSKRKYEESDTTNFSDIDFTTTESTESTDISFDRDLATTSNEIDVHDLGTVSNSSAEPLVKQHEKYIKRNKDNKRKRRDKKVRYLSTEDNNQKKTERKTFTTKHSSIKPLNFKNKKEKNKNGSHFMSHPDNHVLYPDPENFNPKKGTPEHIDKINIEELESHEK